MSRAIRLAAASAMLVAALAPGAGVAHQTTRHGVVAVGAVLPPTIPAPIVIVAQQAQAIPSATNGVALIGTDAAAIDCMVVQDVGPTGHRVSLRGTTNQGAIVYITIIDDVTDRFTITYSRGSQSCGTGQATEFSVAGTAVVAG